MGRNDVAALVRDLAATLAAAERERNILSAELTNLRIERDQLREQLEAARADMANVRDHYEKTKAAAKKRRRVCGEDGLTVQLESEAVLLNMLCKPGAGQPLLDELAALRKLCGEAAIECPLPSMHGRLKAAAEGATDGR